MSRRWGIHSNKGGAGRPNDQSYAATRITRGPSLTNVDKHGWQMEAMNQPGLASEPQMGNRRYSERSDEGDAGTAYRPRRALPVLSDRERLQRINEASDAVLRPQGKRADVGAGPRPVRAVGSSEELRSTIGGDRYNEGRSRQMRKSASYHSSEPKGSPQTSEIVSIPYRPTTPTFSRNGRASPASEERASPVELARRARAGYVGIQEHEDMEGTGRNMRSSQSDSPQMATMAAGPSSINTTPLSVTSDSPIKRRKRRVYRDPTTGERIPPSPRRRKPLPQSPVSSDDDVDTPSKRNTDAQEHGDWHIPSSTTTSDSVRHLQHEGRSAAGTSSVSESTLSVATAPEQGTESRVQQHAVHVGASQRPRATTDEPHSPSTATATANSPPTQQHVHQPRARQGNHGDPPSSSATQESKYTGEEHGGPGNEDEDEEVIIDIDDDDDDDADDGVTTVTTSNQPSPGQGTGTVGENTRAVKDQASPLGIASQEGTGSASARTSQPILRTARETAARDSKAARRVLKPPNFPRTLASLLDARQRPNIPIEYYERIYRPESMISGMSVLRSGSRQSGASDRSKSTGDQKGGGPGASAGSERGIAPTEGEGSETSEARQDTSVTDVVSALLSKMCNIVSYRRAAELNQDLFDEFESYQLEYWAHLERRREAELERQREIQEERGRQAALERAQRAERVRERDEARRKAIAMQAERKKEAKQRQDRLSSRFIRRVRSSDLLEPKPLGSRASSAASENSVGKTGAGPGVPSSSSAPAPRPRVPRAQTGLGMSAGNGSKGGVRSSSGPAARRRPQSAVAARRDAGANGVTGASFSRSTSGNGVGVDNTGKQCFPTPIELSANDPMLSKRLTDLAFLQQQTVKFERTKQQSQAKDRVLPLFR